MWYYLYYHGNIVRGVFEVFNFCKVKVTKFIISIFTVSAILLPVNINLSSAQDIHLNNLEKSLTLGVMGYATYKDNYIRLMKNPEVQKQLQNEILSKSNGQNTDERYNQFIDNVIQNILKNGVDIPYDQLPFVWSVSNSKDINATCSLANVVTVHKGLIDNFNWNENEVAFVLSHEIAHGVKKHSLEATSQSAALYMASLPYTQDNNILKTALISVAANYVFTKNTKSGNETIADEFGFEYMARAGYNPGAGSAVMVKLDQFFGETKDSFINPSSHPQNIKREVALAKFMNEYSNGHITVDNAKVLIDNNTILEMVDNDTMLARERAYLVAGALAKSFHDLKTFNEWNLRIKDNAIVSDALQPQEQGSFTAVASGYPIYTGDNPNNLPNMLNILSDAISKAYQIKSDTKYKEKNQKNLKIETQPSKATNDMLTTAAYYCSEKKYDQAIMQYNQIIKKCPTYADAYYSRGCVYSDLKIYDKAIEDYNKAIVLNGKSFLAYYNRGNAYSKLKDYNNSIESYNMAISINPKHASSYFNRGNRYEELGKTDKAIESFQIALKLAPQFYENLSDNMKKLIK